MDSKEIIFWNFKNDGGFSQFMNYEEYQRRNDKKEEPVRVIKESRSEEIQRLKANYNPKPINPVDLKKLEKERADAEDKKWRKENLLTKEHRERFESWGGKERLIKKLTKKEMVEKIKIEKENEESEVLFNNLFPNNQQCQ